MPTIRERFSNWVGADETGSVNPAEVRSRLENFYSSSAMSERWESSFWHRSPSGKMFRYGLGEAAGRGMLSSFLPMEAVDPAILESRVGKLAGALPKGAAAVGKRALGAAFKWLGPVVVGHRLYSEIPKAKGIGGKLSKTGRIFGEEAIWGATMGLGLALGPAITGALLGSAIPGAGTIVGLGAGLAIGAAGTFGFNKMADVAEMPFRLGARGWNYLKARGRASRRLEMGGNLSAGNRTMAAATMRQRALQQMGRSGMNMRSLLGREATLMHVRL